MNEELERLKAHIAGLLDTTEAALLDEYTDRQALLEVLIRELHRLVR